MRGGEGREGGEGRGGEGRGGERGPSEALVPSLQCIQ